MAERGAPPIGAEVLKAVIAEFCQTPGGGDDRWPECSIGIAAKGIVATDSHSAILIGEYDEGHVATQRKEAELAAERAKKYHKAVDLASIPLNVNEQTGEPFEMPKVQAKIREWLRTMRGLGTVTPEALIALGKVGKAAGASSIDIFQPAEEGDAAKALGFKFTFFPKPGHVDLFNPYEGPISVQGVFMTLGTRPDEIVDEEELPELTEETPPASDTPKRPAKRKSAEGAVSAVAQSEPERQEQPKPEPVDVFAIFARGDYRLPPLANLARHDRGASGPDVPDRSANIVDLLLQNGISARVLGKNIGPRVTQYEIQVPPNVKAAKVKGMEVDLALQLGVESVRIEAPIRGKNAIGIEVPHPEPKTVSLLELCASDAFVGARNRLTVALGQDVGGKPIYADLAAMPHLLVAGATNSGKSIGVATMLTSLLLRNTPKDLRLVLIDPKRVEMALFDNIPHLMCPVITDTKEAAGVLRALWREMDRRYELCQKHGVRNIDGYNAKAPDPERLPFIVCVIDELADLMLSHREEVETTLVKLAQMARAVGIHLVIATQRPSVDVVTGLIKANVPSRIAFAVASMVDSRVVIDTPGAERLVGKGDMLFSPISQSGNPTRVQGAYVSEDEVGKVCQFWRDQAQPQYEIRFDEKEQTPSASEDEDDPLLNDAIMFAVERGQMSTSMLQRKFSIGFQRSSRLLDEMERMRVVGPRNGPNPRETLISRREAELLTGGERK